MNYRGGFLFQRTCHSREGGNPGHCEPTEFWRSNLNQVWIILSPTFGIRLVMTKIRLRRSMVTLNTHFKNDTRNFKTITSRLRT